MPELQQHACADAASRHGRTSLVGIDVVAVVGLVVLAHVVIGRVFDARSGAWIRVIVALSPAGVAAIGHDLRRLDHLTFALSVVAGVALSLKADHSSSSSGGLRLPTLQGAVLAPNRPFFGRSEGAIRTPSVCAMSAKERAMPRWSGEKRRTSLLRAGSA